MATQPSILSSAKQFLIEALENHAARKWNFAIVHAVTAVELVLKERLARIHPALIFKNIDAPGFRDTSTVSLSHLPQRLRNLNVSLDPKEIALIKTVANWRNQIVHHMPSFDKISVDQQLPAPRLPLIISQARARQPHRDFSSDPTLQDRRLSFDRMANSGRDGQGHRGARGACPGRHLPGLWRLSCTLSAKRPGCVLPPLRR
jgi:hypothetical protein